ncbi:murein DD-endopeptidase MepM/ murein hydrolase activator NlpD [Erythromicrobium ramosum]|uniref:Murein DD-endopeptidase MepM/ murein hydrolase activator NlpD n=2 Tax=Erythrobacter ramosus TaxID=35811 RepID=A0ABR6HVS6_9SPHN|nr:murein DD-endopeptidase MepM/ murein hydrolase activator NlpD [Erythrobacter ramosus]
MSDRIAAKSWGKRLRQWFPDREFFMRADGQVRFIKLSSKLQIRVAAGVVAMALLWLVALAVMAWGQYRAEADLASFAEEKARVATTDERIKAYGGNLDKVVDDLKQRQEFLDEMARMLPEDIVAEGAASGTVSDSSTEAAKTVQKVGAMIPQARGLAEIEARQLAFVERLTRFADARARRAESAMRKLDLDPKAMSRDTQQAMGGPFEAITSGDDIDPRFERLGLSLARMAVLERALDGIPQVVPASVENITSGFGYRRDPFNGHGAMHAGIDFKGAMGSPIFAAAEGRVTFAGWKSGYGQAIEITHGNGMLTRYAHLSRIDVTVGQAVAAGATIGGLGSTGRSTGPHLHFEVRINDRAVNPRPFLEAAPDVLKEVRSGRPDRPAAPAARK